MPADIEKALKGNDLQRQIERVRITPHPLSTEELSKLWAVFQAPYRVSVTYEASVVLIDSSRRTRAALPVLGRGVGSVPSTTPAFPTIDALELPSPAQPAARLPHTLAPAPAAGDAVTIVGHDFTGTALVIQLAHRLLAVPRQFPVVADTDGQRISLTLPDDQSNLPVGRYAVTVVASQSANPDEDRVSNEAALAIAPRIRQIVPDPAVRDAQGKASVTVHTSPEIWPQQRASLLIGSAEFIAAPRTAASNQIAFDLSGLPPGAHPRYAVRLRVDGVDSLVIDYTAASLAFDATQTLGIV